MKKQQQKHFKMQKTTIAKLELTALRGGLQNPQDPMYETYYSGCPTYSNWVCK